MARAKVDIALALELELRLLRCSLLPFPPKPTHQSLNPNPPILSQLLEDAVSSIEKGDYSSVLSSAAARLIFPFAESWEFEDSMERAEQFYLRAESSAESFVRQSEVADAWLSVLDSETEEADRACRVLLLTCLGVAAFLAFTQINVTGPLETLCSFPLPIHALYAEKTSGGGEQWDMWARRQLTAGGSDLLGKFSLLQYIVYSRMLLTKAKELSLFGRQSYLIGTKSVSWWLMRVVLLQQRILDERLSSLYDLLQVLMRETLHHFGKLEMVSSYWDSHLHEGEGLAILSSAYLEAGIIEHVYARVDSSRTCFNHAEEACGLHLSISGVLGFRTVHQTEAKPQMVLVADINEQKNHGLINVGSASADKMLLHSDDRRANCDILMIPKLLETGNTDGAVLDAIQKDNTSKMPLNAIQQAVILAHCLIIKSNNRDDEMQGWEMAPFIEAIDAQQLSYFIIRCFCNILRIRWESTRSRTKERALMMFDKLVEGVYEAIPGPAQRMHFAFGLYFPTVPAMRKEYGELLVGCGMIGEALKTFEDLELWDSLIYCYRLLGKKAAAVDLIKARLCHTPNDPRLWCSLGDVTNDDAHYVKALEVSNDKSARAKRSLARCAYNRGEYEKSKILWESAMAINSLYPDGWFALGAAALKARDIDKALDGFTRAVQLDPDNGEAWNNIACLHMIKKRSKEAFIAFKEALKFRRTSWQLWENFSCVAMDIGNVRQALEASKMVLDLTNNKRIDAGLLEKLIVEMEARFSRTPLHSSSVEDHNCTSQTSSCDSFSDSKIASEQPEYIVSGPEDTELNLLGKVLQQIVRSGGGEDIWGLYARWHKIKGDLTMSSEALLKQVRSYQGSDLWHNQDRFRKFAHASLELCKVYMEIVSSTGSNRELSAAEMHLRNTVKQAARFSDTEEFRQLTACLDEVKRRLEATSTEKAMCPSASA